MAERMTERMTAEGESIIAPLFQSGDIMIGKFDHKTKYVARPGLEDIKKNSCSTQLSLKFILLINVKMPTVVDILTFTSRINDWL